MCVMRYGTIISQLVSYINDKKIVSMLDGVSGSLSNAYSGYVLNAQ
ncbi:hypothetical protein SAMN05661099_1426 [Daejeonella lutea]|uniref:Uncharacterized protein n=1 Tax=Daejeonella lutea TaxID=572036 RepID=A0A1T5B8W8_9SPHI|nr:hypothetical protein SAMN05661099_1426 [Daejeonella lutea]